MPSFSGIGTVATDCSVPLSCPISVLVNFLDKKEDSLFKDVQINLYFYTML